MGTTWTPMTRMEPRSWLLGNGEVVKEPPFEMSGSGRKFRVVGTTTSVFASEFEELLARAIRQFATEKQTSVVTEVTDMTALLQRGLDFHPQSTKARLHLIHDAEKTQRGKHTTLWWRFKDSNSPFEAMIVARIIAGHNLQHTLRVQFIWPGRGYGPHGTIHGATWHEHTANLARGVGELRLEGHDTHSRWEEYLRDNPPEWTEHLTQDEALMPRPAVQRLRKAAQFFEGLAHIEVPDFGDLNNPSYRQLDLYETNVNAEVLSDMAEYLDGGPVVEKATRLYEEMLETLRSIGINVQGKSNNDFMAALLAGEKGTLNMRVYGLAEQRGLADADHTLSVHLPTGTFIVECSHQEVDKNLVAEKWEEMRTMASLTGNEDELLAYARRYAEERVTRRTEAIMRERRD